MGFFGFIQRGWNSIIKLASIDSALKDIDEKLKNVEGRIHKMEIENAANNASLEIIKQSLEVRIKRSGRKKK